MPSSHAPMSEKVVVKMVKGKDISSFLQNYVFHIKLKHYNLYFKIVFCFNRSMLGSRQTSDFDTQYSARRLIGSLWAKPKVITLTE
jgi:hypothetical protein